MTAIVEGQTAEETGVIFVWFTHFFIVFWRVDSSVFGNITRQVLTTADRVIADFRDKPGDICDQIHDPFTVRSLLTYPL